MAENRGKTEPSEKERFLTGLKKIVSVPKSEILRREREAKEARKRARARKAKGSANINFIFVFALALMVALLAVNLVTLTLQVANRSLYSDLSHRLATVEKATSRPQAGQRQPQ